MSERNQTLLEVRRKKAQELRELGVHPFGSARPVNASFLSIEAKFPDIAELPGESGIESDAELFSLAGRVIAIRDFGKGAFIRLREGSGAEGQIFLKRDLLSAEERNDWAIYKKTDLGDHVHCEGSLFQTKRGDRAILVQRYTVLTKALRAPPEKFHGLSDQEQRYRQRYLDLISNGDVRELFVRRSKIISWIRAFLDQRDFMEVETPMMHSLVSGATARPFSTHHNALNMDLSLRIAPELHLKRLVVGGFEKVYEIGRNFRNEGLSPRHNPEFTMLEFYWAHASWQDLMSLTEEMVVGLIASLKLSPDDASKNCISYQGQEIDFSSPWKRLSMREAVLEKLPALSAKDLSDAARLREEALKVIEDKQLRSSLPRLSAGELIALLFEELVESSLQNPTFVTDFPIAVSPLARRNDQDESVADRFELYIAGREIANGFNELGDPDDQRSRFEAQMEAKAAGADETMDYDEDYIQALEQGLPPTAGEGIGIDRLVMLLTDAASIRDVILFPLMRPNDLKLESGASEQSPDADGPDTKA